MKKYTLTLFLIAGFSIANAQTYALDPSFGDAGVKFYNTMTSFQPTKGIIFENNYYLMGPERIVKIDYDGNIVTGFGTNGSLTIAPSAWDSYKIKGIEKSGSFFYIYGYFNTDSTYDMFIYKIDTNGVFDATFGTNGKLTINMGGAESLESMVVEPSGKLFGLGMHNGQLIYFKLNTDGSFDTSFDATGYKTINISGGTNPYGLFIAPYDNGYLISGRVYINSNYNLFFFKVSMAGVADTSFGAAGIRTLYVPSFVAASVSSSQLFQNKVYLSGFPYAGPNLPLSLAVYDIASNTAQVKNMIYSEGSFAVDADGMYSTGYYYCGPGNTNGCGNKFNLRKRDFNGDPDPSFQNNAEYQYSYPYATDNVASLFIKDEAGRILIAGYKKSTIGQGNPSPYNGFMMIRLGDVLATTQPTIENVAAYPNPFVDEIHINAATPIQSLVVSDLSGRMLSQPKFTRSGNDYLIDLSSLSQSGVYLLTINNTDGTVSKTKIMRR